MIATDGAEESSTVVKDSEIGNSIKEGKVVSRGRNEVEGDGGVRSS